MLPTVERRTNSNVQKERGTANGEVVKRLQRTAVCSPLEPTDLWKSVKSAVRFSSIRVTFSDQVIALATVTLLRLSSMLKSAMSAGAYDQEGSDKDSVAKVLSRATKLVSKTNYTRYSVISTLGTLTWYATN